MQSTVDSNKTFGYYIAMDELLFNTSVGLHLTPMQVAQEIVRFMCEDTTRKYKVTLGTDSMRLQGNAADFVTAIVGHRVGRGGRYFWRRFELGKFHTLRDRIVREVLLSLDLGKAVLLELQKLSPVEGPGAQVVPQWEFEIHIDVGERGETRVMIQEVVGMVRAHNFEAIVKPGSYAASNVADRYV